MNEKKPFLAYTLKMANYLCHCGHDMIGIIDEEGDTTGRFKVVLFENTEKLRNDVYNYTKLNKKER